MPPAAWRRDERGLIGKLIVLWLVVLVLLVAAAIDAGSILLARYRATDLAQDASSAAAEAFAETGDRRAAVRAALATIGDRDRDARLKDLEIAAGGKVTVRIADRAGTLLAGRLPFLERFTRIAVSDASTPSG